jgi:hypothetical protein
MQTNKYLNSIFESNEWLGKNFGQNYKEISIVKGDITQARWGFGYKKNSMGFKIISMPQLSQCCGPWIDNFGGKPSTLLGNQFAIFEELIHKLPEYDYLKLNLDTSIVSAYPLHWNAISYTVRYTYIIKTLASLESIEANFDSNIRKDLNKGRKNLVIEESDQIDISKFVEIHRMVFERNNIKYPYSEDFLLTFFNFLKENNVFKVLTAKDADGNIHSQVILVDDFNRIQYVFGATDTQFRGSGSNTLLLYKGIEIAKAKGKEFNFYGSMTRSIERYFRSFGAEMTPYFAIESMSKKYRVYNKVRTLFK